MPLSSQVNPHNLIPGKKYFIDIQWNLTNDLRLQNGSSTIGTFISSNYIRGRTHSYDTGLQVLLSRSRFEASFKVDGEILIVSSVNKFYEVITPHDIVIAKTQTLFNLHLPNDIKKHISKYTDYILDLHYRPKPK